MKSLSFTSSLIPSILNGLKKSTYRRGLKKDIIQVGDVINIKNDDTDEVVAQAKIVDKQQLLFSELPLQSEDHFFACREEMREQFEQYYAYIGRSIEDDDVFLIISFELIQ